MFLLKLSIVRCLSYALRSTVIGFVKHYRSNNKRKEVVFLTLKYYLSNRIQSNHQMKHTPINNRKLICAKNLTFYAHEMNIYLYYMAG